MKPYTLFPYKMQTTNVVRVLEGIPEEPAACRPSQTVASTSYMKVLQHPSHSQLGISLFNVKGRILKVSVSNFNLFDFVVPMKIQSVRHEGDLHEGVIIVQLQRHSSLCGDDRWITINIKTNVITFHNYSPYSLYSQWDYSRTVDKRDMLVEFM